MSKVNFGKLDDPAVNFPEIPGVNVSVSGNKQYVHSITLNGPGVNLRLEGKISVLIPNAPGLQAEHRPAE